MYEYKAKITAIYDGDTVTADIDLGFGVWLMEQKIRLYGINTPEIRGPEREKGLDARDYLRAMIMGMNVTLKTHKDSKEKYGRWLGEIVVEHEGQRIDINRLLIDKGFAVPYMDS